MNNLELAFDALKNKNSTYTQRFNYYTGTQPLKYSTERLKRAFNDSSTYFAENWLSVVVNAVLDRLVLKGFDSDNTQANNVIDELFTNLNMQLDSYDVHESALITGESFVIVDKVEDEIDLYFNDPRQVAVFYDPNRPKIKAFAAKQWTDGNQYFMNLYYLGYIEHYVSDRGNTAKSYKLAEVTRNDFGQIPVFHFRNSRRENRSELDKATISIQDAVNKLFSDLMVAAEFEAFKMRVFISQVDPGEIKISPDMKLWLPANEGDGQDTTVIELGGSALDNFLKPMSDLASALAITTRTPKHYLFNTGANLSGEALLVAESSLVKKVKQYQEMYSVTWTELATFLLQLRGINILPSEITPVWESVEANQPLTESQIIKTYVEAGVPLQVALQHLGWDKAEIDTVSAGTTL